MRRLLPPAVLLFAACLFAPMSALGADDEFKLVIQDHAFQPPELAVPAGRKIKLIIENRDGTPEEFESHTLNREKVVAGKSTVTLFIGPLKPGSYPFVGEHHENTAKGVIVAK